MKYLVFLATLICLVSGYHNFCVRLKSVTFIYEKFFSYTTCFFLKVYTYNRWLKAYFLLSGLPSVPVFNPFRLSGGKNNNKKNQNKTKMPLHPRHLSPETKPKHKQQKNLENLDQDPN